TPKVVASIAPPPVDRQVCLPSEEVGWEWQPFLGRTPAEHDDGGGLSGGRGWLAVVDCAVATVYSGSTAAIGGVCGRGSPDDGTGRREGSRKCPVSGGRRRGSAGDDDAADGAQGGTAFVSSSDVVLLWVVVWGVFAAVRREFWLAKCRRWNALALLVIGKAVVAGSIIAASSLRLGGGGPAWLVCAVEACRSVAVLALIFAAVQSGIGPADEKAYATADAQQRTLSSRRGSRVGRGGGSSKVRSKARLKHDPTTPRGEHLANPGTSTASWVWGNDDGGGGGSRKRNPDVVPSPAKSDRTTRVSVTQQPTFGEGGGGGGGGGGWFGTSSWHNSSGGEEAPAAAASKKKSGRPKKKK
ncbi:unnamed protein product, partial [Ectocarpus sp. 12 AP-2014]